MALLVIGLGLLPGGAPTAAAADLATRLASAEEKVAQYEGELPALQSGVSSSEGRYQATARRAGPLVHSLHQTESEVRHLQRELTSQQQKAKTHIARLEEQHQHEVDDHDEEVRSGVGFGLSAMVAGLIALAWGWFRGSPPAVALTRIDLGRAIGICVGGGFLLLIVGAVLGSSNGALGALGSFLFCLGLILPSALLLARHSVEVQSRRKKPLLRRERLPRWTSLATAGLMLVLFLAGTGSALFATGASSAPITSRLEGQAEAGRSGAKKLRALEREREKARRRAAAPLAARARAGRELASARRKLRHAQRRLNAARSSWRSLSRQLNALEAKEQREREKEEERLEREETKRIEEEERTSQEESECDPNYSGCLDPSASDYDCEGGSGDGPLYTGTVEVLGVDHYGLDSDGDGIGCESE